MGSIREYKKEDGSVSYHAEVRLRGNPPQRSVHRTRSLAKKWIQDTESAIRDGRHFKSTEAKRHTLGELIDRFINQWLPKHPKRQAKQTALLTWWKNRLGHLLLADVTPAVIAEARDALLSESTIRGTLRSSSTVNRYLAALSKAIGVAVKEWGWLDDSPMSKVAKPSEAPGRDRFLSLEEKDRLLDACRASTNPYLYPLVSLALLTGMRYGELVGLQWADVQFERGTITLRETKNGDRRVVPLIPTAAEIFKQLPGYGSSPAEQVFKSERRNGRKGIVSIRKAFQKALEIAQIDDFRFHDLRHTAASYFAMNGGATQGELMSLFGWRSVNMTRRYAHYSQKHIADLMQRAESTLVFTKSIEGGINGAT
jgi:integrase